MLERYVEDKLENAATSIFFKPAKSELNLVAKKMNINNQDVLRGLQKGECIVQGQFLERDVVRNQDCKN
ncbi:MAG: hypothetical protein M3Z89_16425 [Lysinibacillus fusiformis]|nr:hypothetical protein [Staphylococcus epidermidis]MCT6929631.1 hypothetical protein [Lysinibacillus fusiformis]MCT6934026.1 hypothetical protein [Lysinibacillus fusiformis]